MKAKPIKQTIFEYLEGSNFNEINETINLELNWENHVGKSIANNTKIISFKKGILTIKTSNPIWRNELSLQKKDMLKKLNNSQLDLNIKEIIFR